MNAEVITRLKKSLHLTNKELAMKIGVLEKNMPRRRKAGVIDDIWL